MTYEIQTWRNDALDDVELIDDAVLASRVFGAKVARVIERGSPDRVAFISIAYEQPYPARSIVTDCYQYLPSVSG